MRGFWGGEAHPPTAGRSPGHLGPFLGSSALSAPLQPGCFSGSRVGPGGHTQVPLGVGVKLRVQGTTLWKAASHNQHRVLVILQAGLGVPFHRSVLHLPGQCQLELLPKIGGRRLGARVRQSARVNTRGPGGDANTSSPPHPHGQLAPRSTPGSARSLAPGTSKEAPSLGTTPQDPPCPRSRTTLHTTEPGFQRSRVTRWRC